MLSTSIDGTLRKWIIPKITIGTWHIHRIYENLKGFSALAILPNSNIVSGSGDFTIKIWRSEYPYNFIATLTGHTNYVFALAILNNSNIVSGSADTTIKIWQSESPYNCIANLTGHTNSIFALAILPNSNIVSGSGDTTIKLWQSESPYNCSDVSTKYPTN